MGLPRRGRFRAGSILPLVLLGGPAWAQAFEVPPDLQAAILTRALAYDRALKVRAGAAVVIGVVAKPADKTSASAQEEMLRALSAVEPRSVQGLPLKVVAGSFKDRAGLLAWIDTEGVDALYVTPGLADEIDSIRSVCEERKLVSISSIRSFVERGLAVAVVAKGETPRLLVNLKSAAAAGMDLDPKLLQLSEVLR